MPTALSSLRAVDGAASALRSELRALVKSPQGHADVIFLKDVPAKYREALGRQGVRDVVTIDGEQALPVALVEQWVELVRKSFHVADSCEQIPGRVWRRRFAFGGIANGELDAGEVQFARGQADKAGVGPMMVLIGDRLGLPPAKVVPTQALLPAPTSKVLPPQLVDKVLADSTVTLPEVWQLVDRARRNDPSAQAGRPALAAFGAAHRGELLPEAGKALDLYVAQASRPLTVSEPHASLKRLWAETRRDWDLTVIEPPAQENTPEQNAILGRDLFKATNEEGYRLGYEIKKFFETYPSSGGRTMSTFFAGWAINETFADLQMQAYNFTKCHPVDKSGNPRGPLWRAYVNAVKTGAPRDIIEEAFFRAHIADYKGATQTAEFRKLFEISPKSYRKVIIAFVHTLRAVEAELDLGTRPIDIARRYPLAVTRELVRRGTIGMVWTRASFVKGLSPTHPLTREWWGGFYGMIRTFFTNHHPKTAAPTAIALDLTQAQRHELSEALGLELTGDTLDAATLATATFAEPLRGSKTTEPLPRYALSLTDFQRPDPLHAPLSVAGVDGVFQAKEVLGVVRQAQARVRSNLLHDFQARYPSPLNGLLIYSANMLALTGSYHQNEAYGVVPNFLMPVDNFGRPKSPKWQAYVDAHERQGKADAPSTTEIEKLWLDAHMEDFAQVDSPEFRAQAQDFWVQAIDDKALAPLATFFMATLASRDTFVESIAEGRSHDEALASSLNRFRTAMTHAGTVTFLVEEARNVVKLWGVGRLVTSSEFRKQPELDARGLPTDRTLMTRMLGGLVTATGAAGNVLRGGLFGRRVS